MIDTTTEGFTMNQGVPLNQWFEEMLEDVTPVEQARVSKHRKGRTKSLTREGRRRAQSRRDRATRERISNYLTAKAIREALDGPGA